MAEAIRIALIGPDSTEVQAWFKDHTTIIRVTINYGDMGKLREIEWEGRNWVVRRAADPVKAYNTLREMGFQAVSEEEEWLQTGKWPE